MTLKASSYGYKHNRDSNGVNPRQRKHRSFVEFRNVKDLIKGYYTKRD